MIGLLSSFAAAFLASVGVIRLLLRSPGSMPLDVPDPRKLHTWPTPRGGGLGILVGVLIALPVVVLLGGRAWRDLPLVMAFAFANGLVGFVDDRRPMRSRVKFAIQVFLAVAAYIGGLRISELALPFAGGLEPGWLSGPLTVLWLVWMTNLYNFMDGLDALAGGAALAWCVALAALCGPSQLGLALLALAGGVVGFLLFNRPPARIFMGDVGSFFIGSLFAGVLVSANDDPGRPFPLVAGVLLCGPFVWDATYTIIWRAFRGEDWLHPHRRHLFQRLVLSGLSKGQVRASYLVASAVFSLIAIAYGVMSDIARLATLSAVVASCLCYSLAVGRLEARAIRERRHPDLSGGGPGQSG